MEIVEAIKTRKSIRAFLPHPVPKETIEQVLELAKRSPSWANTQPWEVAVLGGEVMVQVQQALAQAASSGMTPSPDIPFPRFPESYIARRRSIGSRLYELMGINREDRQARLEWARKGNRFFDAPNGFIFYQDRELSPWSMLDLGLFSQTLMLAAVSFGLGTCSLAAAAPYPAILRQILGIPEEKKIVYGMAIGYPDWQYPANKLQSPREPVSSFARWYGF